MRSADDRKHCVYTLLPTGAIINQQRSIKELNLFLFFFFERGQN